VKLIEIAKKELKLIQKEKSSSWASELKRLTIILQVGAKKSAEA